MKYVLTPSDIPCQLTKLSVVSGVALTNRGLPDNNNLKLPLFNIGDLRHFAMIDTLELEGFNVRNENIMQDFEAIELDSSTIQSAPCIVDLKLKNCIWEYPFEVQDFGPIKHLQVIYTDCYRSFTCM